MNNFSKYVNSLLNEATQEEIDKLKDAMEKVSDRPFNELFKDKGDRFLIKVYNPTFEKSAKSLDLDIDKFDWKKREYDGKNINKFFKGVRRNPLLFIAHKMAEYDPEEFGNIDKNFAELLSADEEERHQILIARGLLHMYKIINFISKLKQTIDQNNIYYYLLFSRHPIDVLRMSDHKGISSCHRLNGGRYSHCALADAKNDGGIIYLIKGGDARRIQNNLDDKDIFEDKDRNISGIRPLGRIRLRRFIDLQTGKDFAVPTTLQDEQKYGTFTTELYEIAAGYTRKHQLISQNPPTPEYAAENIVLVGGTYSDESLDELLNNFFKKYDYGNIKHKTGHVTTWNAEIQEILNDYKSKYINITSTNIVDNSIKFEFHVETPLFEYSELTDSNRYNTQQEIDGVIDRNVEHANRRYKMLNDYMTSTFKKEIRGEVVYLVGDYQATLHDPDEMRQFIIQFRMIDADTDNYWTRRK
jgi:hypothetical protein